MPADAASQGGGSHLGLPTWHREQSPGPSSPPTPTSGSGRRGAAHPEEPTASLASGPCPEADLVQTHAATVCSHFILGSTHVRSQRIN